LHGITEISCRCNEEIFKIHDMFPSQDLRNTNTYYLNTRYDTSGWANFSY